MNKSINLNSTNIINTRDNLSKKISSYWKTIESTNLMSKKAVKDGYRKYDLKSLYNQITQMAINRVKSKLLMNAINSGIKKFNFKDIKNDHYYRIYMLNELNEQKTHLTIVKTKHTIDPATKAKLSKKGISKDEVFTNAKCAQLIGDIDIKIQALKADIEEFNKNAKIELEIDDNETFTTEFTL